MSKVGDAINKARTKVAAKATKFMPDLCDLIAPSLTDQGAGHTLAEAVIAANIPCEMEQVSGGGVQINENGTLVTKTHRLKMVYTAATVAITRHYKIKVKAQGLNSETLLEKPVNHPDSKSPFMIVLASLNEGYQQPGVT